MTKFKVLTTNVAFMMPFGIYSRHLTEVTNEFFTSIAPYFISIAMISVTIVAWFFVRENWSTDVKSPFEAIKVTLGGIQCLGMFVSVGLKFNQIKMLHLNLQGIVDESTHFYFSLYTNLLHFNINAQIDFNHFFLQIR